MTTVDINGVTAANSELYPSVFVTRGGSVFTVCGVARRQSADKDGYMRVSGVGHTHRLVAAAWCTGYAPGLTVNHINGVKTDNRAENLEWISASANTLHAISTGLITVIGKGERHRAAKLKTEDVIKIRQDLASGVRVGELARSYKMSQQQISSIKAGIRWRHLLPSKNKPTVD